ncbi:MAG: DUF1840 domain-containing protein [Rhodoferax sp.]
MLYKFKSKATGDLIMLEPNGRQILKIIGKDDTDTRAKGILHWAEMPAAVAALQAAIAQEEALSAARAQQAQAQGHEPERPEGISLRQRAVPFIDMLQRSQREKKDIVWGV